MGGKAVYKLDENGIINLNEAEPLMGCCKGVDFMGYLGHEG